MADADESERRVVESPTDLKFVGPATATAIEGATFSAQAIADKDVSYRMLLEAGVNPGVAAKIRRHHSLAWSFDNDGDLGRRSEQVRGLKDDEAAWVADSGEDGTPTADSLTDSAVDAGEIDDEAAWVAESSTGDDTAERTSETLDGTDAAETAWVQNATGGDDASATADGSGDPLVAEAAWRERSKPTPLTDVSGIGESYADRLAEAGVTSIRSLATASPELLADVTGISQQRVERWHREASEKAD